MAQLSKIRRRLGSLPALLPLAASPSRSLTLKLKGDKNKKGKQCRCCGLLSSPPLIASVTSTIMAAGLLALFFAPPLLQVFRSAEGIQEYDAVIVGAGWAGISAADTLLKGGVENILVVEAADVIGGRSKSVNLDGSINNPTMHGNFTNIPIDLGSEWLYDDTELKDILVRGGYMKGVQTSKPDAYFVPIVDSAFYLQTHDEEGKNGLKTKRLEDDNAKVLENKVWGGFKQYRKRLLGRANKNDQSYWSAVEKYRGEELTEDIDIQFLDMVMAAAGQVDLADNSNKLSLSGHKINEHSPDPCFYTSVPGVGYGNTAAKYADQFVSHKVHLNSKVSEIDYSNPSRALISFTRNGEEEINVLAKTVLVTASLGVLKAGNIDFTPRLPHWKKEVIDGMGFGTMNKCVLIWNDPNAVEWPDNEWIELMTPKGENSGKWTTFFNPTKYKCIPVLVGFVGGENARYMETQTDEEIIEDVMTNLKAMFPSITPPDRHAITRWGSDENVLGTYSYKIVGRHDSNDRNKLRKAVENIWFAGEATSSWYGTTVGAFDAGAKAAKEMLKVLSSDATSMN